MKKDVKKIDIAVKTPWYKILISLIIIGMIVFILELFNRNFLLKFSLYNLYDFAFSENIVFLNYSLNPFLVYSILFVIIILIVFLIIKFVKNSRESDNLNNNGNVTKKDMKKVLKVTDKLLGDLPKEEINKFSKSSDSKLYKKVLKNYGVK